MREGRYGLVALSLVLLGSVFLLASNEPLHEGSLPVALVVETEAVKELHEHHHGAEDNISDRGHGVMVGGEEVVTKEDMWLGGMSVSVKNAPRSSLHHANVRIYPPASPHLPSSLLQFGDMIGVSVGQDTVETLTLSEPYAVFVPKGSRLIANAMLHNPLPPEGPGGTYHDVSVEFSFLRTLAEAPIPAVPLFLTLVDKDSRSDDTFTVPAKTTQYVRTASDPQDIGKGSYVLPSDGMLVELGAHMHAWQGAKRIDVFLNGQPLKSFESVQGEEPWEWSTKRLTLLKRVHKGDVLSLSATYTNEESSPVVGAMAIVAATFAPDPPARDVLLSF